MSDLAAKVIAGDRRGLARAITLVESDRPDHRAEAVELLEELVDQTGGSVRVGVSGAPGAGKSTLIETMGLHAIEQDASVAVLAVDPSSTRSGGSILGDKTRMAALARSSAAFIRPSPSGGTLGGVARRTREVVLLCEAAGVDLVVVETVGVGQSEVAVAGLVDLFVLVASPTGGDELQGIKRGIMELADVIVVNKADGELLPAARRAASDLRKAVHLLRPKRPGWEVPVLLASAATGQGIPELWDELTAAHGRLQASSLLEAQRAEQAVRWMWDEVTQGILDQLRQHPDVRQRLAALQDEVAAGRRSPTAAAADLLDRFGVGRSGDA